MISLTVAEIAKAINGRVVGDGTVMITGTVETDSRICKPGSLFVAKPGEATDGHLFIPNAMVNGANAAIVEYETNTELTQIVVEDSVLALGLLAKFVVAEVRAKGNLQVIAVTGSNGKTTTKNMLRTILSKFGNTVAPEESFNNEVGAPYSMLKIDQSTQYLVLEYGAGGLGSIAYLVGLCQPDIAIELKVGLAHVGEFGGIEITEKIKAELVTDLPVAALALLNFDDPRVRKMQEMTQASVRSFAIESIATYRATEVGMSFAGTHFTFSSPNNQPLPVTLKIIGEHQIYNALAALAVAVELGLDLKVASEALESMELAERWRMQILQGANGLTVINDAYNASPDSMRAGLTALAELGRQTGRRTVAVLGEMAELGQYSADEHDSIGRLVVRLNIGQLVVVGAGAKLIHMGASLEGSWDGESRFFDEISTATEYLRGMLSGEEIVLVKSSKSANLRYLGDDLIEEKP